jgi:hypothetical protein
VAVAAAAVGAIAAIAGGASLVQVGVSLAVTTGLNFLAKKLAPSPSAPSFTQRDRSLTFRDPAAPRPVVYGRARVGGPITFARVTDASVTTGFAGLDTRILHIIVPLAGHEVASIDKVYFGDRELQIDQNGNVVGDFNGYMVVKRHTGAWDQAADPELLQCFPDLDANFRGRGVAYLYCQLRRSQDVFPNGLQNFSADVFGRKLYDPRDGGQNIAQPETWGLSFNAALACADYVRGVPMRDGAGALVRPYGVQAEDAKINWEEILAEANICDEDVNLAAGGTEKRYTCNGRLAGDTDPRDGLQQLLTSMAGRVVYSGGFWSLRAGATRVPIMDLSRDDLRGAGGMRVHNSVTRQQVFSAAKGLFISQEAEQLATYPLVEIPAFETGTGRVIQDVDLPFTNSAAMAQRIARIAVMQSNMQTRIEGMFSPRTAKLAFGDWVTWTDPDRDWDQKEFVVDGWRLTNVRGQGGAAMLGFELVLQEVTPDVYAAVPDAAAVPAPGNTLPDAYLVPAPQSLTVEVAEFTSRARVRLTCGTSASDLDVRYRFSYVLQGTTNEVVLPDQPERVVEIADIPVGLHTFRVRAVNRLGRASVLPRETVYAVGRPPLTNRVTGLQLVGGANETEFTGPDAQFIWRPGSVNAPGLADPLGADVFDGDEYLAGYRIAIFALDGTELRSLILQETQFTYTLDMNRRDSKRVLKQGPQRSFIFRVEQRGKFGGEFEFSTPVELTVSNPAPAAVTALTKTEFHRSAWVGFQVAPDGDLEGTIARGSAVPGFDPAAGEGVLLYQGNNLARADFTLAAGETVYVSVAAYDAFGTEGLNWSSEIEVTAQALTTDDFGQELVDAIATAENLQDGYAIRITDDLVQGFFIGKPDGSGDVVAGWLVDRFLIAHPSVNGGVPVPAFVVEGGAIKVNELIAGSITTDELKAVWAQVDFLIGNRLQNTEVNPTFIIDLENSFWEIKTP